MAHLHSSGSHAAQFYEHETFLHSAIASSFVEGAERGDAFALIVRPRVYEAVADTLLSGAGRRAADAVDRICFVDAERVVTEVERNLSRPDCLEALGRLMPEVRPERVDGIIRYYGEVSDLFCARGQHAVAAELESLSDQAIATASGYSITCTYAMEHFDTDTRAVWFREVCRHHEHVLPGDGVDDAVDEETRLGRVALWHQQARVLQQVLRRPPAPGWLPRAAGASNVYVVDDDAGVRRSLVRLLGAHGWPVQAFESAEAFLAQLNTLPAGCLVLDIQLPGISGLDLQTWLTWAHAPFAVVALSGSLDPKVGREAIRRGALAFLRKPLDDGLLIEEVTRACAFSASTPAHGSGPATT